MPVGVRARSRYTAAVLGEHAAPEPSAVPDPDVVARGVVTDVSRHVVCVATSRGEERFLVDAATTLWCGREVDLSALRAGDDALVRCRAGRWVAERIWIRIARVSGVIAARSGETLEVDTGHTGGRRPVAIPYRSSGRIGVRHPVLESGYLFDAIGVWEDGVVQAAVPATTQPPFAVWDAAPSEVPAQVDNRVNGAVSWYDPAVGDAQQAELRGAAYPALDRESDCGPECDRVRSCLALPLLSIGTPIAVRNECAGASAVLPVLACASAAARFCDSCADCSPRAQGRIAQSTLSSFAALGGRPEAGCFNATLTVGW